MSGTATLVSTSASGSRPDASAAVGVTHRLHQLVVNADARGGNHEPATNLDKSVLVDRDDAQCRPVGGQLDRARAEPQFIAQRPGDDQAPRLINGSPHP